MRHVENIDQYRRRQGDFTWMEKYALRRFHPRRIVLDSLGWMWGTYFLWNHSWESAVLTLFAAGYIGNFIVRHVDPGKMARTALGKLALLHLNPANLVIQLLGLAFLVSALWNHSGQGILVGISVIGTGHLFGWSRVDDAFASQDAQEEAA